jgi:hypothetical protein
MITLILGAKKMSNVISHCLKPLNKKAENIFKKVIANLPTDKAKYIGEKGSAIMQVVVEQIYHENNYGKVYAVGHYFIQNGDRMSDPEMTFLVNDDDGRVYPLSFEQHGFFARYEESVLFNEDGTYKGKYSKRHNDHKNFANQWMENIKHQQSL